MKKTKVLLFALVVALMFTAVGYAYWSDQITVNNTVSTGELKVEFDRNYSFLRYPNIVSGDNTSRDYVEPNIVQSQDNKTITVTAGNMYPGAMALYAAKMVNKGTIPVLFDNVKVEFTSDNLLLKESLIVAGGYMLYDKNNSYKNGGVFSGTLGQMENNINNMLKDVRMETGDFLLLDIPDEYKSQIKSIIKPFEPEKQNCIIFYLPEDADNTLQQQTAIFNIRFNFKQHNQSNL